MADFSAEPRGESSNACAPLSCNIIALSSRAAAYSGAAAEELTFAAHRLTGSSARTPDQRA